MAINVGIVQNRVINMCTVQDLINVGTVKNLINVDTVKNRVIDMGKLQIMITMDRMINMGTLQHRMFIISTVKQRVNNLGTI